MGMPEQAVAANKAADKLHVKVFGDPNKGPDGENVNGEAPEIKPEDLPGHEDPNNETWKARYQALQGKYNAEIKTGDVPQLKSQIQSLTDRNANLERQVSELSGLAAQNTTLQDENLVLQQKIVELNKAPTADTTPEGVGDDLLTDDERADLEDEEISAKAMGIIAKAVRRASVKEAAAAAETAVRPVADKVNARIEKTVEDELAEYKGKVEQIPDFLEINNSPEFNLWLDQPISKYSTETRRQKLNEFNRGMKASSVEGMFADYIAESGFKPASEANNNPPGGDGAYVPPAKSETLEPSSTHTGEGEQPLAGGGITADAIKKHYERMAKEPMGYARSKEAAAFEKKLKDGWGKPQTQQT